MIHTFYHDYSRTLQLGRLTLFPICFGWLTLYPNRICARTWTLQGCYERNWRWRDLRQVIWLQHPLVNLALYFNDGTYYSLNTKQPDVWWRLLTAPHERPDSAMALRSQPIANA